MKSMKGLSMNRMLGGIRKKSGSGSNTPPQTQALPTPPSTEGQSPEMIARNHVKAFCEAGGNVQGDEVLFLPPIVESAESSPTAAAECAQSIRKFLTKEYHSRPSWQYNAIMLLRILTDNPGATFTRNLDQKFVDTVRALLKSGVDNSVRQITMETLEDFEQTKGHDENLVLLVSMWKQDKGKALRNNPGKLFRRPPPPPNFNQNAYAQNFNAHAYAQNLHHPPQNYFARSHKNNRLPDPVELVSRLEEARTSAKLLEQVVMNTPSAEMLDNDLIKEFADRCLSASRSIQGYMVARDPSPDNDTMESLIDTNEQLQTALNQHQRAVLSARKQLGLYERGDEPATPPSNGSGQLLQSQGTGTESSMAGGGLLPVATPQGNGKGKATESYEPPPGPPPGLASSSAVGSSSKLATNNEDNAEDPFKDPAPGQAELSSSNADYGQRHSQEPFSPGFNGSAPYATSGGSAYATSYSKQPMAGSSGADADGAQRPAALGSGNDSDDDLYEASPRGKEPMHRY